MKRKHFWVLVFIIHLPYLVFSQTISLAPIGDFDHVKSWKIMLQQNQIGKAYSIEKGGTCDIVFAPSQDKVSGATLVFSGTYTSEGNKVAGKAYQGYKQIGNPNDKLFKPNSYLIFDQGGITFSNQPGENSVQVYKVIENGSVLTNIVSARTKNPTKWRFLIEKKWRKDYLDGKKENGVDLLIVDFDKDLTLTEACNYVNALGRNTDYEGFSFVSAVTACLLDTGDYRAFLFKGTSVDGVFNIAKQSNVIVVK